MKNSLGCLGLIFKGIIVLLLLLAWAWGFTAIFLNVPGPQWQKLVAACLFGAALPGILLFCRSFFIGFALCLLVFGGLIYWWQSLQPSNTRDWADNVAKVAYGEIKGNTLTMHNVRNFRYITDQYFDENWKEEGHWETREYNLDDIQGLDLFLSYWGSDHIAHTILSWDFGNNSHLAISIETRKDKSQEYSAIKGFFKQYELSYVAGEESDLIRLRTNYRKERVYAYRLMVPANQSRALLESYVTKMNSLVTTPEFYDALLHNCTTAIQLHVNGLKPGSPPLVDWSQLASGQLSPPIDWRIIASGHIDERLYDKGILLQSMPFTKLKAKSRIDERMQLYGEENFSTILRYDLPRQ